MLGTLTNSTSHNTVTGTTKS